MIAVTFALPVESMAFIKMLVRPIRLTNKGVAVIHGSLQGKPIVVSYTGVGEKRSRFQIHNILREQRFQYLVSAGFAGALNEQLKIGHVFVADNFTTTELRNSLVSIGGEFAYGKMVTSRVVVDGDAARSRLATESGAIAVDMETEFIAAACRAHHLPLVALRAISDTPSQPLPAPPNVLFNMARQKPALGRLAIYLATHPSRLGQLVAFRQRVALARQRLAIALAQVIGNL